MVRSASSRVSNHESLCGFILRDAAKRPLLRMRTTLYVPATTGFGAREIVSVISDANMHSAPATKNAGR
jgi:hypothetical protein